MKTKRKESNLLYLKLRNIIYENIFNGDYIDGSLIPTERDLSKQFKLSRITVRSTLEMLEGEGFVSRVQGRGTTIRLKKESTSTDMGIIAVVAPNRIPFFSSFIETFNDKAEKNDSLVLLKTQSQNNNLNIEKYLFKLFVRNVRNVVLWLHDSTLDMEYIRRLRGMGMNFVFFDIVQDTYYGDGICLDNKHAVEALYNHALEEYKEPEKIAFCGWDNLNLSSIIERESCFRKCSQNKSPVLYIPWENRWMFRPQMLSLAQKIKKEMPSCFICGNGELGIELRKILNEMNYKKTDVYCIDEEPEAAELRITTYDQPMNELASKVYDSLQRQNQKPKEWKPRMYRLKGKIIKRSL